MRIRLQELRKARDWTGQDVADKLGITKGYVSELENGKKTPGARLLMRMAAAFGCEVHELFDGSPEDRTAAELAAHMEVMKDLPEEDRRFIQRSARGLLPTSPGSSEK